MTRVLLLLGQVGKRWDLLCCCPEQAFTMEKKVLKA